jgi:small conductance mechanosensitive channel
MFVPLFAAEGDGGITGEAAQVWETVVRFVTEQGSSLVMNLLAALVIFIVGRWVAKLLRGIVTKLMARSNVDETLRKFLANMLYGLLLTFVVLAAVDRLGVDTTSFAAIIAAAGLAVGFALQGSLANFAAGVMLILFKPFKVGDFIEAGGSTGIVEEIHIFNTLMRTGDNIQITIPNSQITGGTISNYSAKETRRIDLVVGCGYDDDIRAVKKYLEELIASEERILKDPEPVVAVHELGDNSVNFVVRPWVNTADYWAVRWDLTERIKTGFDEKGFSIPYPQRDVHVHKMTAVG